MRVSMLDGCTSSIFLPRPTTHRTVNSRCQCAVVRYSHGETTTPCNLGRRHIGSCWASGARPIQHRCWQCKALLHSRQPRCVAMYRHRMDLNAACNACTIHIVSYDVPGVDTHAQSHTCAERDREQRSASQKGKQTDTWDREARTSAE